MGVERADWEITVRAVLEHTSFGQAAWAGRRVPRPKSSGWPR